jgi:glycosyltransferase involved in cell wall biosynthesis
MLSKALDRADEIIATTRSYAETSKLLKGREYHVIPNGIDLGEFQDSEVGKEPLIVFLGRLSLSKGVDVLIRAMREVEVEARCVIIGDGEEKKRFMKLAKDLEVNVEFTGFLPREEVVNYLKRASLLVLPSVSRLEAFGIVLLEAMACGTPVVASDIPGVRDVASEAGLLFPPGDHRKLAEIINELLSDEEKIRKLGEKGKRIVREKYSWDVVIGRLIEVYERCLA